MIIEKYTEASGKLVLPCVVDAIYFVGHVVLDIILHKDQVLKKDQELEYNGENLVIQKALSNKPIKTLVNIDNRTDYRKVRYFCLKK